MRVLSLYVDLGLPLSDSPEKEGVGFRIYVVHLDIHKLYELMLGLRISYKNKRTTASPKYIHIISFVEDFSTLNYSDHRGRICFHIYTFICFHIFT